MFSAETMITMGDSTSKNINLIRVNDIIVNKLLKAVKVTYTHTVTAQPAVGIQLNNGSGVFYCDSSVKFLCHNVATSGSHLSDCSSIENIHNYTGTSSYLKSSSIMFGSDSDISITTYDDPVSPHIKTLYCIHTNDPTQTFFANKVIVMCNSH